VQKHVNGTYLRDFRTTDGSRLLQAIAHESDLSITTFKHIKAMLSGVFTYAKNEGLFDGANPVQDVFLPNARPEGDTFAYFLPEICQMVTLLPEPARTIVATAAFTGLREGELRGLDVTDFNGETLRVSRSIWRSHVNAPKGAGEVPVIGPLAAMLTMHIWHAWGIR
jgi:integrase